MDDFKRTTQARSWLFDDISLQRCKQLAVRVDLSSKGSSNTVGPVGHARKFASGFHRRNHFSEDVTRQAHAEYLTVGEQEQIIRFHSQQIKHLVGPDAILHELRTSETVLFTAITFFRRFFLSNSVAEIHPRRIAAACAFFASKVEEECIRVSLLEHSHCQFGDTKR